MNLTIVLEPHEQTFLETAADTMGDASLAEFAKKAVLAATELLLIRRIEDLRPVADSLPAAKTTLESLIASLEAMYAIGLPTLDLEEVPRDVDEIIALLQDTLNDLRSFLRRQDY